MVYSAYKTQHLVIRQLDFFICQLGPSFPGDIMRKKVKPTTEKEFLPLLIL